MLLTDGALEALLGTFDVQGVTLAVLQPDGAGDARIATQTAGHAVKQGCTEEHQPVLEGTFFQLCSLSKPIAAVYALEHFTAAGISLDRSANGLLADAGSPFRFTPAEGAEACWADEVSIAHLLDHTGPQMHYVNGVPHNETFPPVLSLISGTAERPAPYRYAPLLVAKRPGTRFGYSGGGFLVLQHLLELGEEQPAAALLDAHLCACGGAAAHGLSFAHEACASSIYLSINRSIDRSIFLSIDLDQSRSI